MTAHITFHFAIGMIIGSGIGLYWLARRWYDYKPLAPGFLAWFAWSYGLGFYAIIPSFLRHLGFPEGLCRHWLMNIFLLHPLIDKLRPGSLIVGGAIIIAIAVSQYIMLLLALRRARRKVR